MLWGTDNVLGQIFQHIFKANGRYCVYYSPNIFRNTRDLRENHSDIPQFLLGHMQSRGASSNRVRAKI